jgi:hypothetical protein
VKRTRKAWVAAIGATIQAASVSWVTVEIAASDGVFDGNEIGSLTTAAFVLVSTVLAVWRVPNSPES